jgi:hypothetical protein
LADGCHEDLQTLKTNFTICGSFATFAGDMRTMKKFLLLILTPLLLTGCSTITNLTPAKQSRNATGLYPIDVAFDTRQQSLRPESVKPTVLIGNDSYPMRKTPLMKNRWETLVPIPADKKSIDYHFRFYFEYNAVPQVRPDSIMSREYHLDIVDKTDAK